MRIRLEHFARMSEATGKFAGKATARTDPTFERRSTDPRVAAAGDGHMAHRTASAMSERIRGRMIDSFRDETSVIGCYNSMVHVKGSPLLDPMAISLDR